MIEITDGCIIETSNGNKYLYKEDTGLAHRITENSNLGKTGFLDIKNIYTEDFGIKLTNLPESIKGDFEIVKISKDNFTFWEKEFKNEE